MMRFGWSAPRTRDVAFYYSLPHLGPQRLNRFHQFIFFCGGGIGLPVIARVAVAQASPPSGKMPFGGVCDFVHYGMAKI